GIFIFHFHFRNDGILELKIHRPSKELPQTSPKYPNFFLLFFYDLLVLLSLINNMRCDCSCEMKGMGRYNIGAIWK
ncbi:unnamed protein product, partial [Prunus brigantina]